MTVKENEPAQGVPYFTPAQNPPPGTPRLAEAGVPTVFTPLKIRDVTLNHRITVSPMCTYSADDGHLTDWHLVHYGQFAKNGASLVMVEATAVEPRGRISPEDSGIWADSHIAPLKRVTDFIHSQGQKAAIQLAHAGRKASDFAPWIGGSKVKTVCPPEQGGWPDEIVAPSAIPWNEGYPVPHALTVEEIAEVVKKFADGAERSIKAGFDVIEIHGAHGYLISEFLSPVTNQRTDEYGGSFENRARLLHEVIKAIRAVIPSGTPLFVRISATEWIEHLGEPSFDVDSAIRLAKTLPALGVDLLDVSTSGNNPKQKIPVHDPYYQADISGRIRAAVRAEGLDLLVGAVGQVNVAERARELVQDGPLPGTEGQNGVAAPRADLLFVARQFLRQPNWVYHVGEELGLDIQRQTQYHFFLNGRKR